MPLEALVNVPVTAYLTCVRADFEPLPRSHYESSKRPNALVRLWRADGWLSLTRGLTAYLLGELFYVALVKLFYRFGPVVLSPAMNLVWALTQDIVVATALLPFSVVMRRTMAHPHLQLWWRPSKYFAQILSPAERKQPWRLYFIPGLFFIDVLKNLSMTLMVVFYSVAYDYLETPGWITTLAYWFTFLFIDTPFEFIQLRLIMQDIPVAPRPAAAYTANSPPVNFRPTGNFGASIPSYERYNGILDCVRKILREEGLRCFMRGLFIALLFHSLMPYANLLFESMLVAFA